MSHQVDIRCGDGSKPTSREEAQAILDRNPPYDTIARAIDLHYVNVDDRGRTSLVYSTDNQRKRHGVVDINARNNGDE